MGSAESAWGISMVNQHGFGRISMGACPGMVGMVGTVGMVGMVGMVG